MDPYQKHEKLILKLLPVEDRIEHALVEGKIGLVTEASAGVSEEDLGSLKSSVTDARKKLNKLSTSIENTPLSENDSFSEYMVKLNDALIKAERAVAEIEITDDPGSVQQTLGEIIAIEGRVTAFFAGLEKTFTTFSKALTPVVPKDKLDTPISELSGAENTKVPAVEKLKSGFTKAFNTAAAASKKSETGGLLQKFGKWLKSFFSGKSSGTKKALEAIGTPPDAATLADTVTSMSLTQINDVVKAIRTVKFQPPPEDATERLVTAFRARSEKKSGESGEGEAKPGEGESETETPAASDDELTKSIDHPRAADFIKALRDNPATKALFEEGFRLSEGFYRNNLSSLLFEAPVKYSDILDVAKKIVPDDEAAQKKLAVSAAKAFKEKKKKTIEDVPDEAAAPDAKKDEESKPGEPDKKAPSAPENTAKTFKGEIDLLKEKHKSNSEIVSALDKFYGDVKDKVNEISVDDIVKNAFMELNKLGKDSTLLLGDPENTAKMQAKLTSLVKDKIKLENRSNRSNKKSVIVESRWAKLAGLKDEE